MSTNVQLFWIYTMNLQLFCIHFEIFLVQNGKIEFCCPNLQRNAHFYTKSYTITFLLIQNSTFWGSNVQKYRFGAQDVLTYTFTVRNLEFCRKFTKKLIFSSTKTRCLTETTPTISLHSEKTRYIPQQNAMFDRNNTTISLHSEKYGTYHNKT